MELNEVDFLPEEEIISSLEQPGSAEGEYEYQEPQHTQFTDVTDGTGISPEENNPSNDGSTGDVILDFLKFQGIQDPSKIQFEDEDGIIKEKDWGELSYEEKMNILTTSQQQPERDLDDEEIQLLNDIRRYNLSPKKYISIIQQQAVKDYADSINANPQYNVEDLTDDDVYLLDLLDKIGDITDEELEDALRAAKSNPSLFAKQVAGMRANLKVQQDNYNQQQAAEQAAEQQEQFNQFRDSVVNSIQSFNRVGDLDINLERDDMQELASFILDKDDTGMSYMGKALNDPRTLVEMAWWTLKGREVLGDIQNYYSNLIKTIRLQSYQKGLDDAKKSTSRVVYKPQSPQTSKGRLMTIDDVWG